MVQATTPNVFENHLLPTLNTAYRAAYSLTRNREDAHDLVQEASFRAYAAFHTFRRGGNFKAWFLRVLTNLFLNQQRRRRREVALIHWEVAPEECLMQEIHASEWDTREVDPIGVVRRKSERQEIADAFASLPQDFRTICVLYFMDELSYQEIADIVDCPIGTVRSRLHRGRKLLQRHLTESGHNGHDVVPAGVL
jgi:RNA polymerase sigma-70 factor, ECF subfamily